MVSPESNPGLISEELFDRFRSSRWPNMFGHMAHAAREQGKPLEDILAVHETGLVLAPEKDIAMLEALWITEMREHAESDHHPLVDVPRYTGFGRQVIAACEGLLTPEEYEAQNEAAKPELERRLAEARAFLDSHA